jgi:hypothetical protein
MVVVPGRGIEHVIAESVENAGVEAITARQRDTRVTTGRKRPSHFPEDANPIGGMGRRNAPGQYENDPTIGLM